MSKLDYILSTRTNGANPFKIWEQITSLGPQDSGLLLFSIRRMDYSLFLKTAYWFSVSSVAKSRAGMRCQVCNCPNKIQVHHRTYDSKNTRI